MRVRELSIWLLAASLAVCSGGCGVETEVTRNNGLEKALDVAEGLVEGSEDSGAAELYKPKMAPPSQYMFETPVRIKAGDEYVSVESPGYACPTLADVDGDGLEDLVVGQFNNGSMQFCKNIASPSEPPEFAEAVWIKTGDKRAIVPGVW